MTDKNYIAIFVAILKKGSLRYGLVFLALLLFEDKTAQGANEQMPFSDLDIGFYTKSLPEIFSLVSKNCSVRRPTSTRMGIFC